MPEHKTKQIAQHTPTICQDKQYATCGILPAPGISACYTRTAG